MVDDKNSIITLADIAIKKGANTKDVSSDEVKKMMKKIAANAVCIGIYNFSKIVVGNISDGDFASIKPVWNDVKAGMVKCLAIINNEGEDIKDILSLEEIEEAVRFTIFELETSEDDDE